MREKQLHHNLIIWNEKLESCRMKTNKDKRAYSLNANDVQLQLKSSII